MRKKKNPLVIGAEEIPHLPFSAFCHESLQRPFSQNGYILLYYTDTFLLIPIHAGTYPLILNTYYNKHLLNEKGEHDHLNSMKKTLVVI